MSLHTCPPDRLQACTDKYLLRRLLASTPLNLPRVFLYALYFTLMPVAVLGPAAGVAGTAVLAGVAAYLWLWGTPAAWIHFCGSGWCGPWWIGCFTFCSGWCWESGNTGCHSVSILVQSHTAAKMSISLRS